MNQSSQYSIQQFPSGPDEQLEHVAQFQRRLRQALEQTLQDTDTDGHGTAAALKSLGYRAASTCGRAASDKAIAIWESLLKQHPDDADLIHHLAIAHHSLAFDKEASRSPSDADPHWKRALELWHHLSQHGGFWRQLGNRASRSISQESIQNIRDRWPYRLLTVHRDIAFDPETPVDRRTFHCHLAESSTLNSAGPHATRPFDQLCQEAYERWVAELPSHVWEETTREPQSIQSALERIEQFLEIVPRSRVALADALRLLTRQLYVISTDLQLARDDQARYEQIRSDFQNHIRQWAPRFDDLFQERDRISDLLCEKLRDWYQLAGDAEAANDHLQQAREYFLRMRDLCGDHVEQNRTAEQRLEALEAQAAMENSRLPTDAAHRVCEALQQRPLTTGLAWWFLANAWLYHHEFEHAKHALQQARKLANQGQPFAPEMLETTQLQITEESNHFHESFGCLSAWRLWRRATHAVDSQQAREFLEQAYEQAEHAVLIRRDLSIALTQYTLDQIEIEHRVTDEQMTQFVEVLSRAVTLDRGNATAAELLKLLMQRR